MNVVFLTSDVGASKKVNGVRVVSKLNNKNHFVENLQKYIAGGENFVFVASNPLSYEVNDGYAKLTFDSFNMSGFAFGNLQIIDARTAEKAEELIKNASVVFLAGGDTIGEMKFFEELHLCDLLKKHSPITIGQSAGALNLAETVYCSPEDKDELENKRYFKGLGLTKINIEPHFKNSPHFDEWDELSKILLEDSKKRPFFAITDGSYIIDDGKRQMLFGEAYRFENGQFYQICQDGEQLDVTRFKQKTK